MGVYRSGVDSGEIPKWYWHRGLYDAFVVGVDTQAFAYDVTQAKPVRNCMVIRLDARGALFDTSVTAIRLYNYKVLRGSELKGCHWMQDRLRREKDKFILDITALGKDEFQYSVRFDFAEVERK